MRTVILKSMSFVFVLAFSLSCAKEELRQTVSYEYIYFTVDLNGADNTLSNEYSYKIYTQSGLINKNERIDSPGVLVFNNPIQLSGSDVPLVAYDVRCPNENSYSAVVSMKGMEATCNVCKTTYNLVDLSISGASTEFLQKYCINRVSSSSNNFRIQNCY